ncbi:MAG: DnaB-like helicase C-terminal domain-containing protein [Syntrophomonas sp.]
MRERETIETNGLSGRAFKSHLIRVADLGDWEPAKEAAVCSGFAELDRILDGGFRTGELTVWSGVNSSGKSTLLSQMLLEALDQEQAVCAYSGELPDQIFRYWLELQAAGPWGVEQGAGSLTGRAVVIPALIDAIRGWYRERLFLCAGADWGSLDSLLETFTGAARDYSCRVFLLDNLTIIISGFRARDQLRTQRELILHMVRFAREFRVHVHIVVHPRKNVNPSNFTKTDIGGSGDITNLADNVLVLTRFAPHKMAGDDLPPAACLSVLKNRFGGRQDEEIYLDFDPVSKRFFPVGARPQDRVYGWRALWGQTPGEV